MLPRLSCAETQLELKTSKCKTASEGLATSNSKGAEFHSGFRLSLIVSVLCCCSPSFITTKGSETSPGLMPQSLFCKSKARITRSLSLLRECRSAACVPLSSDCDTTEACEVLSLSMPRCCADSSLGKPPWHSDASRKELWCCANICLDSRAC